MANKYKITYYLNSATAERRPTTQEDIEEDWIVEEREYPLDIEAFEYVYMEILENDEEDLDDLYQDLDDPDDDLEKIDVLKEYFDEQDWGDGETIIVSIEGPGQTYNSGYSKDSFIDEEELDENLSLEEATAQILSHSKLEERGKRVARYGEFNNGHVLYSWHDWTQEEAEEKAKEASIKDPNNVYYVDIDDIMSDGSDIRWYNGKQYTYDEIENKEHLKESFNLDESKKVQETFSEKLGGEPEDFISDVKDIKKALESINSEKFGTQLAKTMIEEFIETCEDQINMTETKYKNI